MEVKLVSECFRRSRMFIESQSIACKMNLKVGNSHFTGEKSGGHYPTQVVEVAITNNLTSLLRRDD